MIIETLLLLSSAVNIIFFLYCKHLLRQLENISIDLVFLRNIMKSYQEGITQVYESEMYYGEPILEQLVKNTEEVSKDIEDVLSQYDFEELEESMITTQDEQVEP